jgi:hypothetical protein
MENLKTANFNKLEMKCKNQLKSNFCTKKMLGTRKNIG